VKLPATCPMAPASRSRQRVTTAIGQNLACIPDPLPLLRLGISLEASFQRMSSIVLTSATISAMPTNPSNMKPIGVFRYSTARPT